MIVGITGTHGAGKDTVAHHLMAKGFDHIATGDLIRERATELGLPHDRPTLQKIIQEWRAKDGAGALARLAIKKFGTNNGIISGLRHPEEVKVLRAESPTKFILLSIDAPRELRWERIQHRGRPGDHISLTEFTAQEEKEMSADKNTWDIGAVMQLADVSINNGETKHSLYAQVDDVLAKHADR